LLVLGLLVCALFPAAKACNVPAFRYALERWPADLYQVVVYHQTAPKGDEFELLKKSAVGRGGLANYSLKTVDVTKPEGKRVAEQHQMTAFPWVEVLYPVHTELSGVVWAGPLASGRVKRILQSRTRSVLAEKLLSGEVAVWILIRSGHERKDRRALDSLRTSLEHASATLRIPEIGTDQNGDPVAVDDFKTYPVHFALLEIARDDADEDLLVSALLKSEPDLLQYDEPLAFPVFGRGRALYALVGDGIQKNTVLEACQSLINWCSCEIKAANPGTDLLISADWSRPYGGKMVEDPDVPLVGLGGFIPGQTSASANPAPKTDPVKPGPAACAVAPVVAKAARPVPPIEDRPILRNVVYLAGGAGIVLLVLSVVMTVKRRMKDEG